MHRITPKARGYFLAILAALVALLLRKMLSPLLGAENPYLTVWAAIVFSAWYCGVGPSVAGALVCVFGVWYWFLPYVNSFALQNPKAEISGMALFSVLSGFIIALGEANRRSKARSDRDAAERKRIEDELRAAQEQLEDRVGARTAQLNIVNQRLSVEAARVRAQAEWLDAANDAILSWAPMKPSPIGTKARNGSMDGQGRRRWGTVPTNCCALSFPSPLPKSRGSASKAGGRESWSIPGGTVPR